MRYLIGKRRPSWTTAAEFIPRFETPGHIDRLGFHVSETTAPECLWSDRALELAARHSMTDEGRAIAAATLAQRQEPKP